MFNSLIHGDDLFEILLEGGNPYAESPLTEGECTLLEAEGLQPEALDALLIGRVVMGGRGVWALAADRLVLLGQRYRTSVDRLARADLVDVGSERGRYGETVRLHTREGRWAMYGASPDRAARLLQRLALGAAVQA